MLDVAIYICAATADKRRLAVYAIAQASKAVIPKDENGPFGQRIASTVSGSDNLVVTAYETKRSSAQDWLRYSLVVLNQ